MVKAGIRQCGTDHRCGKPASTSGAAINEIRGLRQSAAGESPCPWEGRRNPSEPKTAYISAYISAYKAAYISGYAYCQPVDFSEKKPPADRGLKFREETSKKGNKGSPKTVPFAALQYIRCSLLRCKRKSMRK